MNSLSSFLVASSYMSALPVINTMAAVCDVNGQSVECPNPAHFALAAGIIAIPLIIILVVLAFVIISMWKLFEKAGKPGWASLIPIYNIIVMLEIIQKPTWWVILAIFPPTSAFIGFYIVYEFAKAFGKDIGYTLGLIVLPVIFYPMLAFGDSQYVYGTTGGTTPSTPPTPPATPPMTPPTPAATV